MIKKIEKNDWDDLTDEALNHKYAGDYITISKFGRFHMKSQTIFRHKEFLLCTHVDVRYSKSKKALVFLFNKEDKGMKLTPHGPGKKITVFGSMYFFSRLDLTEIVRRTKKYTVVKEKIPNMGYALVLYFEKNTAQEFDV